MSPPVAAPHCGICCRPFRLHTWTRRAFPRVSSLCATRRLGAVNRRGVCSESGGGKPGLSKGIFLTQLGSELACRCCFSWMCFVSELFAEKVWNKYRKASNKCFWWICGRNESSSEAPAALPAVLLLWSRAGRRHLAHTGHPGTRWDLNIDL